MADFAIKLSNGPPERGLSDQEKFVNIINQIKGIGEFKTEEDVREDFLQPLLDGLGYSNSKSSVHKIERGANLAVSDLIIGTKKKSYEGYRPDYILSVSGKRKWIIDAKNPKESVTNVEHISQAFSYAIHREVQAPFFVLSNGEEFAVYSTSDNSYKPMTTFRRADLLERAQELLEMFSVDAFLTRENFKNLPKSEFEVDGFNRTDNYQIKVDFRPISKVIVPQKQSSPIHFGPHPYFTKRPWNVVREYVEHFSRPGELVCDPFGGTGTTAIESALTGRRSVSFDINPLAIFMANSLITLTDLPLLVDAFNKVQKQLDRFVNLDKKVTPPENWYPRDIKLPRDADVEFVHQYFSIGQLRDLAALRSFIDDIKPKAISQALLFVFSSTLVKCNLGFHNTPRKGGIAGGGDSGLMKYYRYMIPKTLFQEQSVVRVFEDKFKAFYKAQIHLRSNELDEGQKDKLVQIHQYSATKASDLVDKETVDYVFTDPPYGAKIGYLDCSTMFNAWLGFEVTDEDYKNEVIAGGRLHKSESDYVALLHASLKEAHAVLKPGKWMSLVFASSHPSHWHAVSDYATEIGFEHINTVCQPSSRKTVKKNQNPLTVFNGEMILNFRKSDTVSSVVGKSRSNTSPKKLIVDIIERVIVEHAGKATIEQIMQQLIPSLLDSGMLNSVFTKNDDISEILREHFIQSEDKNWQIKDKVKVGCHIPLDKRIRYYLISCLNRAAKERREIGIDEIVMEVIPFLRNGITPSNQDIISELKKIALSSDHQNWKLQKPGMLAFPDE